MYYVGSMIGSEVLSWHFHTPQKTEEIKTSQASLVVVQKGRIDVFRNPKEVLDAGSILLAPTRMPVLLRSFPFSKCLQVAFSKRSLEFFEASPENLGIVNKLAGRKTFITNIRQFETSPVFGLIKDVEDYQKGPHGKMTNVSWFLARTLELLSLLEGDVFKKQTKSAFQCSLQVVLDYIKVHYADELTLTDLAELAGVGPEYFSRCFSREMGMPLFEHINRVRISEAIRLLKYRGKGILETSVEVGYNNVSYFNRCFKNITGMSPTEYRELEKNPASEGVKNG